MYKELPFEKCLTNFASVYNDVFINENPTHMQKYSLIFTLLILIDRYYRYPDSSAGQGRPSRGASRCPSRTAGPCRGRSAVTCPGSSASRSLSSNASKYPDRSVKSSRIENLATLK